jgi:hypothetical protein
LRSGFVLPHDPELLYLREKVQRPLKKEQVMPNIPDIERRFTYHPPKGEQAVMWSNAAIARNE